MSLLWNRHRTSGALLSLCLVAALPVAARAAEPPADHPLFAKDRLVAWCIVPFDASRRGPEERAAMLKGLGLTRLAYDWRDEHIPTFEREIQALQAQGIEFFAYWCPAADGEAYRSMMALIEKYHLHPQLWVIAPAAEAGTPEERVAVNARTLLPYVAEAKRLGCCLALYNHGGWSGEPENMVAMVQWLRRESGSDAVGIVYNFHHGHEHLGRFPAAFAQMLPYLTCVNLNGMTIGGEKILPVGQGQEDRRVLEMIRDSGYRGPIGILDHRVELDAEESLRQNLTGLQRLLTEMGDSAAAATYSPPER
jgi:sugar phosphate isomerase/epimerase